MKMVVLLAVFIVVVPSQAVWTDELPPGVIVTGQMYIHDPDAPTQYQYRWMDLVWPTRSVGVDPGDFLYAVLVDPATAEFGINEGGTLVPGAYEGMQTQFLASESIQEIDLDVYAASSPQWGIPFAQSSVVRLRTPLEPRPPSLLGSSTWMVVGWPLEFTAISSTPERHGLGGIRVSDSGRSRTGGSMLHTPRGRRITRDAWEAKMRGRGVFTTGHSVIYSS